MAGERTDAISRLTESRRIAEDCSAEDLGARTRIWAKRSSKTAESRKRSSSDSRARSWCAHWASATGVPTSSVRWPRSWFGPGRLDEAERLTATGIETRIEGIDTAILASVVSEISLLRSQLDVAEAELERAIRAAGQTTDWMIRAMLADRAALLAVLSGDPDRAAALVDEVIASVNDGEYVFYTARMYALAVRAHADRAERARALGDTATAEQAERSGSAIVGRVERLLSPDRWRGSPPPETVARAGLAAAELERLEGRSDPTTWSAVGDRWADLGFKLELAYARCRQAEATLASAGARTNASVPLQEAARLSAESGASLLGSEIEGLARRARIELGDHDGSLPVETPAAALDRFGLTTRELDVLALVAEGRTNREIGEALFISAKTASTHVSHILSKLDVRSRLEAATAAHRLGLLPNRADHG